MIRTGKEPRVNRDMTNGIVLKTMTYNQGLTPSVVPIQVRVK